MDKTNDLILTLRKGGMSLRDIAKEVGLSHVAIKKRLDRMTPVNNTVNGITVLPELQIEDAPLVQDGAPVVSDLQDENGINIPSERRYKISHYPNLNQAILELDEGLKAVEVLIREELKISEDKGFVIQTPGWKIEKTVLLIGNR